MPRRLVGLIFVLALAHLSLTLHVAAVDTVDVVVEASRNVSRPVPPNFVSFSVEVFGMQWWTAVYPLPTRPSFVHLIQQLNNYTDPSLLPLHHSHRRVFRIGGNSADTSVYNPFNLSIPASLGEITYNITEADILGMDRAMAAVDGQLIVGLNFRLPHDPTWALRHVQDIERLVGWKRIFALEIGNEVNFYAGGARAQGWTYANYSAEWGEYVSTFYAQVASLPKPYFQGLACWGNDWLQHYVPFIDEHADTLLTVSQHFYPESHSNAPNSSVPKLHKLVSDADATEESAAIADTVRQVRERYPAVPFAIGEGNSVSGHGQLNVSTTFGACLWAIHEMMNDIAAGAHTWQWHNNVIEDFTAPMPSSYTAFVFQQLDSDVPTVMPLYYAMRFVTEATRNMAHMVELRQTNSSNELVKVYAFRQTLAGRSEVRVVVLHKGHNNTTPASVTVALSGAQHPYPAAQYMALTANSIYANFGLDYAGQTYDGTQDGLPSGLYVSTPVKADSSGRYQLSVQPASATLLTIPITTAETADNGAWSALTE